MFAILICLIIFSNVFNKGVLHAIEQKLFLALIIANIFVLLLDTGMWIFDKNNNETMIILNKVSTCLYYIMNPIVCLFWALYSHYKIINNRFKTRKLIFLFIIPIIMNTILSILSFSYNILYYIDDYNVYHRGTYFLFMPIISYSLLIYTLVTVILKRKIIEKENSAYFYAYALIPLIGSIFQILFFGLSIIWLAVTLSILIVFINLQND